MYVHFLHSLHNFALVFSRHWTSGIPKSSKRYVYIQSSRIQKCLKVTIKAPPFQRHSAPPNAYAYQEEEICTIHTISFKSATNRCACPFALCACLFKWLCVCGNKLGAFGALSSSTSARLRFFFEALFSPLPCRSGLSLHPCSSVPMQHVISGVPVSPLFAMLSFGKVYAAP